MKPSDRFRVAFWGGFQHIADAADFVFRVGGASSTLNVAAPIDNAEKRAANQTVILTTLAFESTRNLF